MQTAGGHQLTLQALRATENTDDRSPCNCQHRCGRSSRRFRTSPVCLGTPGLPKARIQQAVMQDTEMQQLLHATRQRFCVQAAACWLARTTNAPRTPPSIGTASRVPSQGTPSPCADTQAPRTSPCPAAVPSKKADQRLPAEQSGTPGPVQQAISLPKGTAPPGTTLSVLGRAAPVRAHALSQ
jgi:hypothetical protein